MAVFLFLGRRRSESVPSFSQFFLLLSLSFYQSHTGYASAASSFSFLRFIPRVNVPVATIDSSTTFFGHPVPIPIFFCPTGQGRNGHPDGELNLTRAGARTGFPQGVSSGSSYSINEILAERDELVKQGKQRTPVWWQLCTYRDYTAFLRLLTKSLTYRYPF